MNEQLPFAGRHAIVTGGASGIGAAIARRLIAEGVSVVVADVNDKAGEFFAEQIGAQYAHLDVSDAAQWTNVVKDFGPFDIGFLNAGIGTRPASALAGELGRALEGQPVVPLADVSDEDYRRIVGVNLDGVVFGTRALVPSMCAAGTGDIVVTASVAGLVGTPFDPMYGTTKHAVVGFVRSMAPLLEPYGVCISSINPGFVDTPILGDEGASRILDLGLPLLRPTDLGTVALQVLTARTHGAQWVLWGEPPATPYVWADPLGHLR
jgi:NAD(P)-dependent dehydrogenase (short-subunit alcohol dehydrogenase family)